MPDSSIPITSGVGTAIDTYQLPDGSHRQVVILGNHGGYSGRFTTFRTPGRAGTTGQNLAAIWNATGSTVQVDVTGIACDLYQTAVKAITVPPAIIRICRITTIPTGGTAGFKVAEETANATSASVTTYQDASADGTVSTTALATSATNTNSTSVGLTQEYAPRFVTAAGYEPADRVELLHTGAVTLAAAQGLAVRLDYTVATSNPTTDMWITTLRWEEYTP